MIYGKHLRFCPNCGGRHYDDRLSTTHVLSMMCDKGCREEWQRKYAAMILGHDGNADPDPMAVGCCMVKLDGILILLTVAPQRSKCSEPEWWDKADLVIEVINVQDEIKMCRVVKQPYLPPDPDDFERAN